MDHKNRHFWRPARWLCMTGVLIPENFNVPCKSGSLATFETSSSCNISRGNDSHVNLRSMEYASPLHMNIDFKQLWFG